MKNLKWLVTAKSMSKLYVLLICAVITHIQCAQEDNLLGSNDSFKTKKSGTEALAIIDYELESTTRMIPSETVTQASDMAVSTPIIDKQKVIMEVYEDGTMKLTCEKMTPSQVLNIPHATPPNPDPVPHKTIAYGNQIKFYDEGGVLLYTAEDLTLPNLSSLVASIQELGTDYDETLINDAIAGMQSQFYIGSLTDYLDNPTQNGITVQDLGNDLVSVTIPVNPTFPASTDVAIHLIDKTQNLLLATRLYDDSDNWKSSVMFHYETSGIPIIKGVKIDAKDVLPSGIEVRTETYSSVSNLNFNVNL